MKFLYRRADSVNFNVFDKKMSTEEELMYLRLIEGMFKIALRLKMLRRSNLHQTSSEACIEFI